MHVIIPKAIPLPPAVVAGDVFTKTEIDELETLASQAFEPGETGNVAPIRKSLVVWLDSDNFAYPRLADFVGDINAQHYRFDLVGLGEQIQLARYTANMDGHYDWHQDFGASLISRKLSITVQLTEPGLYDGGDLEIFKAAKNVLRMDRKRGAVAVFPSYQLHRVVPVTRGVRHSLVAWVSGPAFR
jgi:PKHD-type hydroxylase